MKTFLLPIRISALTAVVILASSPHLLAQGTAFTYQGRLNDAGSPANGFYDLRFSIYSAASGGASLAGPLTNAPTGVTNGLFVVSLEFGSGVFTGPGRWLEIGVRTNGSASAYATLAPRQTITPSPYAILAGSASNLLGNLPASSVTSAAIAGGQVVKSLNGLRDAVTLSAGSGVSLSSAGNDINVAVASTPSNLPGTIVSRDANGNTAVADFQASRLKVGSNQSLSGQFSTIAGGLNNQILGNADQSAIGGGVDNVIQTASAYSTVGGGADNQIQANAHGSTVGGGNANLILSNAQTSTIGGGAENTISGVGSFIGGGGADGGDTYGNTIAANASAIAGGYGNYIQANSDYSLIGGGYENGIQTNAPDSTIAGGSGNSISGKGSFIGGGGYDGAHIFGNSVSANASALVGGYQNAIETFAHESFIGGGHSNRIQFLASQSSIGGGAYNQITTNAYQTVIAGGWRNTVGDSAYGSTISGGANNSIDVNAIYSTIGGGANNYASGIHSTVPGGKFNVASGEASFAAGEGASALHRGAFVWADSSTAGAFSSTANYQFSARAAGGVRFFSNSGATLGVQLAPNGTSWTVLSDQNTKANVEPIDSMDMLARLLRLPITKWSYKADPSARRYIGPMAQDFHRAFNLGNDDKRINTLDTDGVTLAAIQGLNQKLEIENAKLRRELAEQADALRARAKELVTLQSKVSGIESQVERLLQAQVAQEGQASPIPSHSESAQKPCP